jgi:hypothetical protein
MTLFDNSNHKEKVLECAWQHFETQLDHFDPTIIWKRLDEINVHNIYNTFSWRFFFNFHVCDSWNMAKQKKIEKTM